MDTMKKLIFLLLAFTLMICGCQTTAPISPNEELPWNGLSDPTQKPRGGR
jgi:hypothetical protein